MDNTEQFWRKVLLRALASAHDDIERSLLESFYLKVQAIVSGHKVLFKCYNRATYREFMPHRYKLLNEIKQLLNKEHLSMTVEVAELDMQQEMNKRMEEIKANKSELHYDPSSQVIANSPSTISDNDLPLFASVPNQELFQSVSMPLEQALSAQNSTLEQMQIAPGVQPNFDPNNQAIVQSPLANPIQDTNIGVVQVAPRQIQEQSQAQGQPPQVQSQDQSQEQNQSKIQGQVPGQTQDQVFTQDLAQVSAQVQAQAQAQAMPSEPQVAEPMAGQVPSYVQAVVSGTAVEAYGSEESLSYAAQDQVPSQVQGQSQDQSQVTSQLQDKGLGYRQVAQAQVPGNEGVFQAQPQAKGIIQAQKQVSAQVPGSASRQLPQKGQQSQPDQIYQTAQMDQSSHSEQQAKIRQQVHGVSGQTPNAAMPASPVFNYANQQFITTTQGMVYPKNLQPGAGAQGQVQGQVALAQGHGTQGQLMSVPGQVAQPMVYVNQTYEPPFAQQQQQPSQQQQPTKIGQPVPHVTPAAIMPRVAPVTTAAQAAQAGQMQPRPVYIQYPAQGQPQLQLFDAYGNPVVLTNIPPGITPVASPIAQANLPNAAVNGQQPQGQAQVATQFQWKGQGQAQMPVQAQAPVPGPAQAQGLLQGQMQGQMPSGVFASGNGSRTNAGLGTDVGTSQGTGAGSKTGLGTGLGHGIDVDSNTGSAGSKVSSLSAGKKSSHLGGLNGLPTQGLAAGPGLPDTMSYRYAKVKINYPIMNDGSELAGARVDTEWARKMTEAENAAHKSAQERLEYDSGRTYAMLGQSMSLNSDQPEIESIKFDFGNADDEEPNRYKSLVESLTLDTEPDNDYDDVSDEAWPKFNNTLRPEDCLVDINLSPDRQVEELTKIYKNLTEQFQENRDRYEGCHEALIHARQDRDRLSCTIQMHELETERKDLDQKLEQCRVQLKCAKDRMEDVAKRKEDEAPLLSPIQAMSGLLSSEINGGMLQADEELIEMSSSDMGSNWENIPGHDEFRKCKINPCKTFANFVPAPENRSVLNTAQLIAANPGDNKFNPFYIYGASGLGKTHLINAIANAITKNKPGTEVTYTRAEDFIFNYVVAIKQAQAMRRQHRKFEGKAMIDPRDLFLRCMNSQIFIIDDVQNFSKAAKSRDAFFEIIAEFIDKPNCQLILASDVPPATLLDHGFNPRLTSRFGSGVCCEVRLPSIGPRRTIASAKSIEAGIKLSENLIDYIANHIQTNIREIEGAVKTLNSNIVNQGYISMNEAMMCLEAFIPRPKLSNQLTNGLTLDVIKVQVSREFLVTVQDLESGSKKKVVTTARAMAMALSKQLIPGTTLTDLGRAFNKDHSSVSDAIRRIFKRMDAESELKSMYEHFVHEFKNFRGQS